MSGRSIAEVESSIENHRRELSAAITDFRRGVDQGARQFADAKQRLPAEARARIDQEVVGVRTRIDQELAEHSDQMAAAAIGVGFVGGGGVGGAARLPLRIVGLSNRSEIKVRRDRHSRQVGRALAGVAAADRQMRRPRGFMFVNARRLILLAPVAAGVAALMAEEEKLPDVLVESREKLLDAVFAG